MDELSAYARNVIDALEPAIGKHTARRALELACTKIGSQPTSIGPAHHTAAAKVLSPMLRTLLGRAKAEALLSTIEGEAG